MDGGVSSAAVEILVQNLIDVIKQEYYLVQGLEVNVQQLQKTLGMIQAYLNDAEKKSITQDAVKLWLRELEALAFDADNVLDEFSYHLLRKKFKAATRKVPLLLLPLKNFAHRRSMALKIEEINMDFESMNKRASDLGLQSMVVNAPASVPLASFETDSLTLDPIFIGRDDDVDKLVDLVVDSPHERNLSILAIVGMGGLGKTTLTRKVFNHQKIKSRFGSLVWVHVSQTFDPIVLFKKILSNLTSSSTEGGVESREVILKRIKEAFKDKTYLLVLDDVWNEEVPIWEDFINSIFGVTSTMGNAIVMSSRKEGVASLVRPLHTHRLSVLSDEECWSIIKAKAFQNGEAPSPEFEMIGREIAGRCKGLPLAANVVGGLLLGCKSEEEWRFVKENRLLDVEGGESIFKILKLSYDHLPSPSLKKCFAYYSIFRKGRWINKQELIEMWMAEGFLKADRRNGEMESDVGDKFINVLLHNSLLLVSERDEYGNVSYCVMHDLVHDVASFVLGSSDGITPPPYMIHVSSQVEASCIPKQVAKHLRTLVLVGDISEPVFSDFESLRVLTLIDYDGEKLPSWIRKLIHLRSLNISKTSIEKLPDWIGELHHLQTLRANAGRVKELPTTLEYFPNLSHLHFDFSDAWNHYDTPNMLPANIGRLTGLQMLDRFRAVDEKGYRIEELGSLNNLKGKLEIWDLDKVHGKEEAEKAKMSHKSKLLDLTKLTWGFDSEGETSNYESVLEGLQPHPNLHRLEIERYKGNRLPLWIEKMAVQNGPQHGSWVPLNKLVQITLAGCFECEEIPRLDHLPNLKSLELEGFKKVRFINSSFTSLTSFSIDNFRALECLPDWLFYNNPKLSVLTIRSCPNLTELPDGLHALTSLQKLSIFYCSNLKSIGNISGGESKQGILISLRLWYCERLMELPRQMVEAWALSLERISLYGLSSLGNLPIIIECLTKSATHRLRKLSIVGVPNFMAIWSSGESWPLGNLLELSIGCSEDWSREKSSEGIIEIVDGMLQSCCTSLTKLELIGIHGLECLPQSIQHLTSLSELELKDFGVEELPEWLGSLPSLKELTLIGCSKLRRLNLSSTTQLQKMYIKICPELDVVSERCRIPDVHIRVIPWYA